MKKNTKKIGLILAKIVVLILFIFLLASVIRSGYSYLFDQDEFLHSQIAYLIFKGYKPFDSLFTTWIPVFHWLLLPVLAIENFTFSSLLAGRIFMIVLFILRILLTFFLVKKVLGKKIAVLSIFLSLLDPFTVFSSMQIRPDNLMMVFFIASLLILVYALENNSGLLFFYSGISFALAALTCLKIAPGLAAIGLIFFIYSIHDRRIFSFLLFLAGAITVGFLTTAYFFFQHTLFQMIQQVTTDATTLHNSIWNLTNLGYFYAPDNPYLYGLSGKPLNWIFSWMLPIMAFLGVYEVARDLSTTKHPKKYSKLILLILVFGFVFHWLSLFFYHSVFLQYYVPVAWFYAIFAAIFFFGLDKITHVSKPVNYLYRSLAVVFIVSLIVVSIKANNARAVNLSSQWQDQLLASRWSKIPPDSYVFPNLVFRPIIDPFLSNFYYIPGLPKEIINRYPPLLSNLKKYRVSYLLINDHVTYYYINPDPTLKSFIETNFIQDPVDKELWIKK